MASECIHTCASIKKMCGTLVSIQELKKIVGPTWVYLLGHYTNNMLMLVFFTHKNSSICSGNQPPDVQLSHADVFACLLEFILWRHGGVLWPLLQTRAGGHASRRLLPTTWYQVVKDLMTLETSWRLNVCFSIVSTVKVKETHCTVTDLLPNAQYELWVTATNTTGISPASEKALYMTGNKCHTPAAASRLINVATEKIMHLTGFFSGLQ